MSMVGSRIRALRRVALASTVLVALASAATASAGERTYSFNFSQISLSEALRAYAKITGQQIIFTEDLVSGRSAPALKGAYTAEDALAQLLSNTGLVVERSPSGAIMVRRVAAQASPTTSTAQGSTPAQAPDPKDTPEDDEKKTEEDRKVERVVVTGTNIRGKYPKSSPLDVYSKEDIERSGATTTDQFIQRLPQNLGTRSQNSAVATANVNREGVNGVDLRGLGVGTTLTLLNGRRLGLSSFGQTADVSIIPLSAIDRVEVLTDGASAIYGSDAIGGVVNFVLRDDFEGAETRLNYGSVTDGGLRQGSATQTFGGNWGTGNALISADLYSASPLNTLDRSYAAGSGPGYLTPVDQRQTALATFRQQIGSSVTLSGDALYSHRDTKVFTSILNNPSPLFYVNLTNNADAEQYFANAALDFDFSETLHGSILATYSNVDSDSVQNAEYFNLNFIDNARYDTNYAALDLTAKLDGVLLTLPSGPVSFSLGAGRLSEDYLGARLKNIGRTSSAELGRHVSYAFAEILAPLVAPDQGIPLVDRLELSLAARYTQYVDNSDPSLDREFGDNISPKIGILWAPFSDLNLRATYGESFRAPALAEIDPTGISSDLIPGFPIAGVSSTVMVISGVAQDLDAESSESYTIGFDYRPAMSHFFIRGTYFNIGYQDRIASGNFNAGISNPASAPEAVFQTGSAAEVEGYLLNYPVSFNGTGISLANLAAAAQALVALPDFWIVDTRLRNLSLSQLDGIDLSAGHDFETDWGLLNIGLNATRVFSYERQVVATSPVLQVVDTVLNPVDLRARAFVSLEGDRWDTTVSINYSDDYANPYALDGAQTVDNWTTIDLNISYDLVKGDPANGSSDVTLSVSVQNLFDQDPPFVASSGVSGPAVLNTIGYDPANASPVGRFVALGVRATW